MTVAEIESKRQVLQREIDGLKDLASRRRMGQFSTPHDLSCQIVSETLPYLRTSGDSLRMLETSMGIGSFVSSALLAMPNRVLEIRGYELDEDFYSAAVKLWAGQPVRPIREDFTRATPEMEYDVVFSNPPYVRHHAIGSEEKARLQKLVYDTLGIRISGLAGLYCHFMLLSYLWMKPGAVGVWLIPSEWMSVNYGSALREFLTHKVRILRVHKFDADDVRFSDALVSSCVVWFRKEPSRSEDVAFTYGPDIQRPKRRDGVGVELLRTLNKWPPQSAGKRATAARIGEYFTVRRGIATGDNAYFVLQEEDAERLQIPRRYLKPILPSPRYLEVDHIMADANGVPVNTRRQFLFDCTGSSPRDLPAAVRDYLDLGAKTTGLKKLCSSRTVWYEQEQRKPTRFLCSYMGRGDGKTSPVRFVLNESDAIAANSFLMLYPKFEVQELIERDPDATKVIWQMLVRIPSSDIMASGRSYGGGLYKVEPKELANVPCRDLAELMRKHT